MPGRAAPPAVERGALMRVLAIAQGLCQLAREHHAARIRLAEHAGEPVRDRRVVGAGARIGGGGEALAQVEAGGALPGVEFGHQGRVVGGVGDHRDEIVVLGRGADHRRAADIDVLDRRRKIGAARDGRLERIEVDHHQVDRRDRMRAHRVRVRGLVAAAEDAAVDLGMQRLDAPVHDLGKAGMVADLDYGESGVNQGFRRASGRQQLDAVAREAACQLRQAGLVGNGNQGAADRNVGHRRLGKS